MPGKDAAFVALVRGQPVLDQVGFTDAAWISLGHDVCVGIHRSDVARGHHLGLAHEAVLLSQRSLVRHWEPDVAPSIMTTAIATLCPQYLGRWEAYLAQRS